jgi:hypothetical protein
MKTKVRSILLAAVVAVVVVVEAFYWLHCFLYGSSTDRNLLLLRARNYYPNPIINLINVIINDALFTVD